MCTHKPVSFHIRILGASESESINHSDDHADKSFDFTDGELLPVYTILI
jgi:hypothetical protein